MEMNNELEGGVCTREREREHELWKADAPQERSLRCSTQKMLKLDRSKSTPHV